MSTEQQAASPIPSAEYFSPEWIRDETIRVIEIFESGQMPPIVQLGHPVLRAQAADFADQLEPELLRRLLDTMRAVMLDAPGVGLAAPQIGIPLRIAVLQDLYETSAQITEVRERAPLEYFEVINPNYTPIGTRTASFYEGCLSFNGYQAVVERPADISTAYLDADGTHHQRNFSGWQARIFQHETDHLAGTVYIDKAITRSLCANAEYSRWANPGISEAKAGLNF